MSAGKDSQDFAGSVSDENVGSDGIHHVDRVRFASLPRTRHKRVRFGRQGADRAQIDDVAAQFRQKHLLNVRADLTKLKKIIQIQF